MCNGYNPPPNDAINLAIFIRDFFLAQNKDNFLRLWANRPDWSVTPETALHLEYEFNRLFVGPAPPIAPPYASVYLEKEPILMGPSTLAVRQLYTALGLQTQNPGIPDDFIAYEFEAWLIVQEVAAATSALDIPAKALSWLSNHMGQWLPIFISRLKQVTLSPPMAKVMMGIESWLLITQSLPTSKGEKCLQQKSQDGHF